MLRAAFEYRDYNLRVYGIQLPMRDAWTSKTAVLDVVLKLFETSARVVETPVVGSGDVHKAGEPHTQLPELAASLFGCFQERIDWLSM